MGADHAGPLFNRVMGNQASDGAYFTRPVAASLAARLTLDVCGDVDWSDPRTWRDHKTVDLACGSGTLLAAMLTDMKRRAAERGANWETLTQLQKLAVEEVIKGLDINPVSLQLAASQLTAGNQRVSYRRMGLHQMPYGPDRDNPDRVSAGTLELLGQRAVVARPAELDLDDDAIDSQATWEAADDAELEDAVVAARNARIVIMNPPFTNRANMGEKFSDETQKALRARADLLEHKLIQADLDLMKFADKNSIAPLFVGLADHCVNRSYGVLTMIHPTVALSNPSGLHERRTLASRYHVHTVLSCHQPSNVNMSQNTGVNESIIVMRRHDVPKPRTRFVNLDRMPVDDSEATDLHRCLLDCPQGLMANGWGEVLLWPAERMQAGDWTPAIWRSPMLAVAATRYANHTDLRTVRDTTKRSLPFTGRDLFRGAFERTDSSTLGSFGVLDSKAEDAQMTIQSRPDKFWIPKDRDEEERLLNGGTYLEVDRMLKKGGYLLVSAGQNSSTARLTATASSLKYVGNSWIPIPGLSGDESKAVAVFINSTPGRLQLMRGAGRTLIFPTYRPAAVEKIKVPNIKDERIRSVLTECWERTKDTVVPQFRDGECKVRVLWDEAVARAMDWDPKELARQRELLHLEPHVRGLGYNQYADEVEEYR